MGGSRKSIAAGDLETDPFEHGATLPRCFLAGYYFEGSYKFWWGENAARDFTKYLLGHFSGIIYFHNGGNFDFHFLLDHLPLADCQFFCIGKRIVRIKVANVEFRDSWAIIPHRLAESGKKVAIEIWKLRREHRQKHRKEIITYWKGDCRALLEMVEGFIERYGLHLTLASTSFAVLRKKFGVKIMRTGRTFDRRIRKHYFAGRVQYMGLGRMKGPFTCLDINSAFPRAMVENHWYSGGMTISRGIPKKNPAQCFYVVECEPGGALAFRAEDGSVEFPALFGRYYTTGWELLAGIKAGVIKRLKVIFCFQPKRLKNFAEFVNHFFSGKRDAKLRGDKLEEFFLKIVLNACYGKWGQNPEKFRDMCVRPWRCKPEEGEWTVALDDEPRGMTFYERPSPLRPGSQGREFYNVAVGASITGWVRAFLWESMRRCKGVVYCDTDSIIARSVRGLKLGTGLGEWKKEKVFDFFWCGGKKLYVGHDAGAVWTQRKPGKVSRKSWVFVKGLGWTPRNSFKTAAKGVKLAVEDLIAVCEGETKISRFDAPTYSMTRATSYTKRTVRRADKRAKAA